MNEKYQSLIEEYNQGIEDFINGLTIKDVINALSMATDDIIGMLYMNMLQCEVYNICAKKEKKLTDGYYRKKHQKIMEIISLCAQHNDIVYGYQEDDDCSKPHIIYFDIPGCEQVSFHTFFSEDVIDSVPVYPKEWDQQINSSLRKLRLAIVNRYSDTQIHSMYSAYMDSKSEEEKLMELYNSEKYIDEHLSEMVDNLNDPDKRYHFILVRYTPNGKFHYAGTPDKLFNPIAGTDGKFMTFERKSDAKSFMSDDMSFDKITVLSPIRYVSDHTYVNEFNRQRALTKKQDKKTKREEQIENDLTYRDVHRLELQNINTSENARKCQGDVIRLLRTGVYRTKPIEIKYDENGMYCLRPKDGGKRFNVVFDIDGKPKLYSEKTKVLLYGDDYKVASSFRLSEYNYKSILKLNRNEVKKYVKNLNNSLD